jgi:polyphosphate glucokinase
MSDSKKKNEKNEKIAIGIDVGGTGIKGAPVDLETGEFAADRVRIPTPESSTPEAVAEIVAEIVDSFDLPDAPVGIAFPGPIKHGVVTFIANLDESWTGTNLPEVMHAATGRHAAAINDADAAGLGELHFGAARNTEGVVLVAPLGTGIGSAVFVDGHLIPNTELGHLEIDGHDAESRASTMAREREDLSYDQWAVRLQRYFSVVEDLLSPDLIVIGGGVSKSWEKFVPQLHLRAPVVPASLRNRAGIVGAAWLAAQTDD